MINEKYKFPLYDVGEEDVEKRPRTKGKRRKTNVRATMQRREKLIIKIERIWAKKIRSDGSGSGSNTTCSPTCSKPRPTHLPSTQNVRSPLRQYTCNPWPPNPWGPKIEYRGPVYTTSPNIYSLWPSPATCASTRKWPAHALAPHCATCYHLQRAVIRLSWLRRLS